MKICSFWSGPQDAVAPSQDRLTRFNNIWQANPTPEEYQPERETLLTGVYAMETLERGTDPTPEEVELVQVSRDEVDLLLREIHHRLMNTFSILAALLRRELSRPPNDIERVLARLEDMILAHAELHRSLCIGGETLLPIDRCVSKTCLCLSRAILEPQGISCVVTTESGHARACDCQRLALIVCELVLNAAKYAFRKEYPGRIQIELSRESEVWRCIVSDNGCGDTFVVTMAADAPPLLSSDRPLFVSGAFGAADCYLTLPIAKDRLFVATCSEEMERTFKSQPQSELIRSTNMQVAKQAAKYVYGSDKSELEFVDKHISTDRPKCFFERLREYRKQKYAPPPP
jgi:two-component sensor histidine kinase